MSHGPMSHQTTTIQALMSLLKGYIGTGILAMPKAFSDSGYVFGLIGTVVIGLLCNCCIHMLVEINELFCSKPDEPPFDYEEVSDRFTMRTDLPLHHSTNVHSFLSPFSICLAHLSIHHPHSWHRSRLRTDPKRYGSTRNYQSPY